MKGLQTALAAGTLLGTAFAINLNISDEQSIKSAASIAAFNTMTNYTSNSTGHIPGKLTDTWWQGAALFETMIAYWSSTGDASNNAAVSQGMYFQRGEGNDYFPANYSAYIGNDDQMAWGRAAMLAAEVEFPSGEGMPGWLELAENVFNVQVKRWDTSSCKGGMRWQIWPYEAGYASKNAISNGGLFQLAARLAWFTGNQTYAEWAEKVWDWSVDTPMIDTGKWMIADSVGTQSNCSTKGELQWTWNYGPYISGAAFMYNVTNGQDAKWKAGINGLLNTTFTNFFPKKYGGKIISEIACESVNMCTKNQEIFKGLLALDLKSTSLVAPFTSSQIVPRLQSSAEGAAKQCTGGENKTICGQRWYQGTWDGTGSMQTQMSATNIFTSNLVSQKRAASAEGGSSSAEASSEGSSSSSASSGSKNSGSKGSSGGKSNGQSNGGGVFSYGLLAVAVNLVAAVCVAV